MKKHNFKQKPLGKFLFHETKKWTVYEFNRELLHTCGGKSMVIFLNIKLMVRDSKKTIWPRFEISYNIKRKWSDTSGVIKSGQIVMLTVSHFTNVNVLFLGFHYLIRYMEIWEKHNFQQKWICYNRESLRNRGGKSSEYFICEFLT